MHLKVVQQLIDVIRGKKKFNISKIMNRMNKFINTKPILPYLEVHVTEHCNMNCKGCGHFSCIAEEEYADIEQYKKDIKRISELFYVDRFRLMGGEPLLNKDVCQFLDIARSTLKNSCIYLVTNAILLPAMDETFWATMKRNNINLDITLYPIMFDKEVSIIELCLKHGITLNLSKTQKFFKRDDFTGSQNYVESYNACKYKHCRFISNGEISTCAYPFVIRHFNKYFGYDIKPSGTINIYEKGINAKKILEFLNAPIEMCKYCYEKETTFDWEVSKKDINEWTMINCSKV